MALGAAMGTLAAPWPVLAASPGLLDDQGPAPEFAGIDQWLNSEPLSMKALAGKVVLVDFWTYACINCINTLPHVVRWYEKYKDQGFVVVGVHTPEFAFEKSTPNVETALQRFGIRYPVAQDNRYATWKAWHNQYWPAFYLIDRSGRVMREHFGEGAYDEMEQAIRALLAQPAKG
jgi:thiol-disulfide isomerase/thioredoxin